MLLFFSLYAGLLLMRDFCTLDICMCYGLYHQSHFIDAWEPGSIYFYENFSKAFLELLFLQGPV